MKINTFLSKKKKHIYYLLQIKMFVKNINNDICQIISELTLNLNNAKIIISFFQIKLNGIYTYLTDNVTSVTTLSSPKVRYFNKRIFGHDILTPHQTMESNVGFFGAVYTSANQITIQNRHFNAYFFNRYKPEHSKIEKNQYAIFSAFAQNQPNAQNQPTVLNGMLRSFWLNHNLVTVENYIGFIVKTNLLLHLHYSDVIPVQGGANSLFS